MIIFIKYVNKLLKYFRVDSVGISLASIMRRRGFQCEDDIEIRRRTETDGVELILRRNFILNCLSLRT